MPVSMLRGLSLASVACILTGTVSGLQLGVITLAGCSIPRFPTKVSEPTILRHPSGMENHVIFNKNGVLITGSTPLRNTSIKLLGVDYSKNLNGAR